MINPCFLCFTVAPRMVPVERYSRAAPPYNLPTADGDSGGLAPLAPLVDVTRVVCIIAAEPAPTVTWFREPGNHTLVEGGQFKSEVTRLYAGRYRATLTIEVVKKADFGMYFCQASRKKSPLFVFYTFGNSGPLSVVNHDSHLSSNMTYYLDLAPPGVCVCFSQNTTSKVTVTIRFLVVVLVLEALTRALGGA